MKQIAQRKASKWSVPPRVRYEPATIDEAVHAARDLTADIDQQVEIAAGLIGMDQHEVRDHVLRLQQNAVTSVGGPSDRRTRVVVVERRGAAMLRERRGARPPENGGKER
jgi:hypothetical protein